MEDYTVRDYANDICRLLKSKDIDAVVMEVTKNNSTHQTGVRIMRDDISPIVYVDWMFEQIMSIDEAVTVILEMAKDRIITPFSSEDIKYLDRINNDIYPKLINYGMNIDSLLYDNITYLRLDDLAITFVICVAPGAYVQVKNDLFKHWKLHLVDLYDIAMQNVDVSILSINNVLRAFYPDQFDEDLPMKIITTPEKTYGAAAILKVDDICSQFDKNQFLIPSSIHEWIAFPYTDMHVEDVNAMIRDVNSNILDPTDILSDHAYILHPDTRQILPL